MTAKEVIAETTKPSGAARAPMRAPAPCNRSTRLLGGDQQAHRDREQEREARRAGAREAGEAAGGDGGARARGAGEEGDGLEDADEQRLRPAHLALVALAAADPVGGAEQQAEDEGGPGDEVRVAGAAGDEVGEQQAGDRGRDGADAEVEE